MSASQPKKGLSVGVIVALAVAIATACSVGMYGHPSQSQPAATQSK